MTKFTSLHEDFRHALDRFKEILREEKSATVRDAAIKRFELVFDLAWKTTKALLEENHNITCASPRMCFREAFKVGLLPYDEQWIALTSERNYTVHVYKEARAEQIYAKLPAALAEFDVLAAAIQRHKSSGDDTRNQ